MKSECENDTEELTCKVEIDRHRGHIPDHLTCLLRNLYADQEAQLELDMEQQTGCKSEKEYMNEGCILSPCLFNLYAEYIMPNAGVDEAQTGIRIAERNNQ